jgi:hypothetical protein
VSTRAAAWLAWSVWTLCVALVLLTGLLSYLTPALTLPLRERVPLQAIAGSWVEDYFWLVPTLGVVPAVLSLTYPTVGALIASRRSHNPIGWLFCLAGLVVIFLSFATAYANYSVFAHFGPDLPATKYMAWLADRAFLGTVDTSTFTINGVHEWREYSSGIALPAMLVVLTWLVLLFPTGRLTSRIWLVAGLGALIGSVLITLWWTTEPGPMYFYPSIDNPFGIEGHTRDVVEGWGKLGWWVGLSSLVVSGFSCADRWIEAQGEERQQMMWFVYSLLFLQPALTRHCLCVVAPGAIPPGTYATSHRRWSRDPPLPPLRDRPHHKPHAGLRLSHRYFGRALLRPHRGIAESLRLRLYPKTARLSKMWAQAS